ncbi:MAG: hypothetical protein DRH30_02590 [Deltaproteobacteria bacterium]|nr:MAG: hypothetical protein DRH30_02590 [Deltaproteobacteria bacterium]
MFGEDLFGYGDGMGASSSTLPPGAKPISEYGAYAAKYGTTPPSGTAHFTLKKSPEASGLLIAEWYDGSGGHIGTAWLTEQDRTIPAPTGSRGAPPAPRPGDGLLPSTVQSGSSDTNWLPWALVGGGVLLAGGIVWSASKSKKMKANRRRRSSRRRRR